MTRPLATVPAADLEALASGADPWDAIAELAARERELDVAVARLHALGLGRPTIARRLGVGEWDVRESMRRQGLRREAGTARARTLRIRITDDEREDLRDAAGGRDLSAWARDVLLAAARSR